MSSAPLVLILEDPFTVRPLDEDPLQERPLVQLRVNNHRVFAGKPFPQGHPLMRAFYGEVSVPMPVKLAKVQVRIVIAARDLDQTLGFDLARGTFVRLFYDRAKNVVWAEQSLDRPLHR